MADIPEHLLQRSKERRKALGLPVPGEEGGEAEAPGRRRRPAEAAADAAGRRGSRPRPRRGEPAPTTSPTRAAPRSPPTSSSGPSAAAAAAGGGGGDVAAAGAGRRGRRHRDACPRPTTTGPGGHTQRLLTVVKSGSIQQTRAEAQDKVHTWPHLLVVEFAVDPDRHRGAAHLLRDGAGAAARPRRLQQDAEPVEGAVVLPRSAGTAHDVPPDGRGRDHPGHGTVPAHAGAVHRQEPVEQAERPEVRDRDLHDLRPDVGGARHLGSFFRGPGFNFVLPWKDGIFFEL